MRKGDVSGDERNIPRCRLAFLFELEFCAVAGRRIMYDVVKAVLKDKGVDLTPALFVRYRVSDSPAKGLRALLAGMGKKRLTSDKLTGEITEGIVQSFRDLSVQPVPGLRELLSDLRNRGVLLGAVSGMSGETAAQLATQLGLNDMDVRVEASGDPEWNMPAASWKSLAGRMSVDPAACVALVSSSSSLREALKAGGRCVVVCDEFTSFQDFGGSDFVGSRIDDELRNEIVRLLNRSGS